MQLSTLICALFASTVLAATSTIRTSSRAPTATPAAIRAAVPRVLKPATPPTATDVQNSITNWMTSVNTVNDYLDNPSNSTKLNTAVVFASDEPIQLVTLMKTTGLSVAGKNAGTVLMGNFGSIVSNLNSVQTGAMSTNDATAAVNFNRCCTVLPAIGALWTAAAVATKATTMPAMPNLESQCGQMSCASGVSSGPANFTLAEVVK